MARKKKDVIDKNDIQIKEVVKEQDNKENKEQNCVHNKANIIIPDSRTLEQKLQSYKRKLRRI